MKTQNRKRFMMLVGAKSRAGYELSSYVKEEGLKETVVMVKPGEEDETIVLFHDEEAFNASDLPTKKVA